MRLASYLVLLFSLSLVFYFLGYQSPLMQLLNNQGCSQAQIDAAEAAGTSLNCSLTVSSFLQVLASNMTSDNALGALLGIAVVGAAVLLTGFGAIYIVPLLMLLAFFNYVVFPISFILDPALPPIIKYPLAVFFNLLTILAIVSFVRGNA
jgi:hypothetical protein